MNQMVQLKQAVDKNSRKYIFNVKKNNNDLKFQVGDQIYKNIFPKVFTPNQTEGVFVIKK